MTPASAAALVSATTFYAAVLHSAGTVPDALSLGLIVLAGVLWVAGVLLSGRRA